MHHSPTHPHYTATYPHTHTHEHIHAQMCIHTQTSTTNTPFPIVDKPVPCSPNCDSCIPIIDAYSIAAAAVAPVSIPPLTPVCAQAELPVNGEYLDHVGRKSIPYVSNSCVSSSYVHPRGHSGHFPTTANATPHPAPVTQRRNPHNPNTSSNPNTADYDIYLPLNALPESQSIVIPPLLPPAVQWPDNGFDDWNGLPDLLRQDCKADQTPRRPINSMLIPFRDRSLVTALWLKHHQSTSSTCVFVAPSSPFTTPTCPLETSPGSWARSGTA